MRALNKRSDACRGMEESSHCLGWIERAALTPSCFNAPQRLTATSHPQGAAASATMPRKRDDSDSDSDEEQDLFDSDDDDSDDEFLPAAWKKKKEEVGAQYMWPCRLDRGNVEQGW